MRVLIAHNQYRSIGGEERHVNLLEEGLRRAGVDVRRLDVKSLTGVSLRERLSIRSDSHVQARWRPSYP